MIQAMLAVIIPIATMAAWLTVMSLEGVINLAKEHGKMDRAATDARL